MSALRSLAFLLFQTLVTPFYAAVMLLLFWLPRVPMYRIAASWCRVNLWGARWICGIRYRMIGAGNIPLVAITSDHFMVLRRGPWCRAAENPGGP